MRKRVTPIETKYKLIQQLWLNQKDIKDLCECGNVRAAEIRDEIAAKIAPKTLPEKTPTHLVVEHMGIDIAYILKVAAR